MTYPGPGHLPYPAVRTLPEHHRDCREIKADQRISWEITAWRTRQGRGLSILFISHDISLVQQFCDRVLVMYHGEIVEEGTPDEVIRNPQNDYTKRLIDSVLS